MELNLKKKNDRIANEFIHKYVERKAYKNINSDAYKAKKKVEDILKWEIQLSRKRKSTRKY